MAYYQMQNDQWLQNVFAQVDKDRSGQINAQELQSALSNGTWKPFEINTVKLFIGMFDKTGKGTIDLEEFKLLWKYVTDWLNCFRSFDRDGSGNIDSSELKAALTTFGYRLSDSFYSLLMKKFDREGREVIYFDAFVHLCVTLQTITTSFRNRDTDMDGVITIGYEDFLSIVFGVCIQLESGQT